MRSISFAAPLDSGTLPSAAGQRYADWMLTSFVAGLAEMMCMLDFMWQADLVGVAKFVMDCLDFLHADVGNNVASDQP